MLVKGIEYVILLHPGLFFSLSFPYDADVHTNNGRVFQEVVLCLDDLNQLFITLYVAHQTLSKKSWALVAVAKMGNITRWLAEQVFRGQHFNTPQSYWRPVL
jgi:hypothetical protein